MKKLLWLVATLCLCSNVFAMEIYKGKLVRQKLWSSDGKPVKLKTQKNMRHQDYSYQNTWAEIFSDQTTVNQPTIISNLNGVIIQNDSDESRHYWTTQTVCSQTPEANQHCVHYYNDLVLDAGGYVYDDEMPILEMVYNKPGNYQITTYTSYGEDGNASSYTKANAVMTVV